MSDRTFEEYGKFSFNSLYNFILKFCEDENEWVRDRALKIKEKIDTYYSVIKNDNTDLCPNEDLYFIKIGWFAEELRDLLYMIITTYSCGSSKDENHFLTFLKKKQEQEYDPNYIIKSKIKHFKDSTNFLSNEKQRLYTKGYNILKCLNQNLSNLEIGITDFPCRYWTIVKELKTKHTEYGIQQIPEGWKIVKTLSLKKEKTKEVTTFILNNQSLEITATEPIMSKLSDEDISYIWTN